MGEWIDSGASGHRAYLALPESRSGPGVLLLHAWWGLTPVFTGICDRLAEAGYVALAPSLFPGGATATTIPEAEALRDAGDEALVAEPVARTAVAFLRGLPAVTGPTIGVIGYSLGAYWALRLSQVLPDDVGAAVVFYGTDDGDYHAARAAYLGHFAEHDDFEPLPFIHALEERMRAAGREVTFYSYPGTRHWFVEPNRPEYDPAAANLAWERTLTFLGDALSEEDEATDQHEVVPTAEAPRRGQQR
ncbi:MAG: dienelactone hydrolase family protein [Thermomicrobiales bacterium]